MSLNRSTTVWIATSALTIVFACKSVKQQPATQPDKNEASSLSESTGRVSHEFKASGCETIVRVAVPNSPQPLILIPKDNLGEFDQDGLEIMFHYQILRMPNPAGCKQGMPAVFTDIRKK
jgi:hypothetical protein